VCVCVFVCLCVFFFLYIYIYIYELWNKPRAHKLRSRSFDDSSSLLEGVNKHWVSEGFRSCSEDLSELNGRLWKLFLDYSVFSLVFLVRFVYVSCAFPLRFLCVSCAFPLRFLCVSSTFPVRFLCVSSTFPVRFLCMSCVTPWRLR